MSAIAALILIGAGMTLFSVGYGIYQLIREASNDE